MLKQSILLILLAIFSASTLAEPALWQVNTPGGGQFWLLGSIHVGKADNSHDLERIAKRLPKVNTLLQELAPSELTPPKMQAAAMRYGILRQGTLADVLSASAYQQLETLAADYGLPMDQLNRTRPWFAMMSLMQAALATQHYNPNLGIDNQMLAIAKARGWQLKGLETVDRQFKALASTDAYADQMVDESVDEMHTLDSTLAPMLTAWEKGQLTQLDQLCPLNQGTGAAYQNMHDATLKLRNQEWVPKLLKTAKGDNTLVVVGLGHIICQDNVLSLLKAKGAKVERLQ
ncbi:TraB/GumN family protein [Gallaecimonas mangrovi]|uniref:TraB/GumN family protein n=1 Tax=Gallaecimonas mangrovi TaxID=2291597 RepID=UPI000E20BA54|nr:TraB/GumN family protein [Gallaecimonas mangrovi]